jgi:alpha-beta hydrolase superfamily lysophospholipase
MAQRVTFQTLDHVQIVGDWVPAPTTFGAVILLHMMPATRKSWASFQIVLAERGLASLAIDLRGHGESTKSDAGEVQFQKFTDADHARSANDVRAAFDWIRTHSIEPAQIAIAGASLGANLALQFLGDEPQMAGAVLLSPGLNYHGVTAMDSAERILPHQGIWMAASRGDDDESVAAVQELDGLLELEEKQTRIVENHGHGTKIFDADATLMAEAADWLRARIMAG